MTSVHTSFAYTQYGSAYARTAGAHPLHGPAGSPKNDSTDSILGSHAATTLTLSEAARARLAAAAALPDFTAVTTSARTALDQLYAAKAATDPVSGDRQQADLSSLDRRAVFAVFVNPNGEFTPDEQAAAKSELDNRFSGALAPAAATTRLTGDYSVAYRTALDFLDAAGPEEKATATWSTQYEAILAGYKATRHDATAAPETRTGDLVAAYLAKNNGSENTPLPAFDDVASAARALLDEATRKTGQAADLSSFDNRSLAAIALNQGEQFSRADISAAQNELSSRTRTSMLSYLQKSHSSGDARQFSLAILQTYSAMSPEEKQALNWKPEIEDLAVQNYRSTSSLLSMLQPSLPAVPSQSS